MKTITATALLSAGTLTPDTPVPCPGTTVVEGREFENQDQFDLGTVPFTEAFAQSCNTTFIQQALELPDGALAEAAASYGVGTDWQLPVGVFGGSVPADSTGTTKAANAIGQGQVLMSPAQMALVAAGDRRRHPGRAGGGRRRRARRRRRRRARASRCSTRSGR